MRSMEEGGGMFNRVFMCVERDHFYTRESAIHYIMYERKLPITSVDESASRLKCK